MDDMPTNKAARPMRSRGMDGTARTVLRPAFRNTGASRPSLGDTARVMRACDVVRDRARNHYETHKDKWVQRQYARLLATSARTLILTPRGIAADPRAALMDRARTFVAGRQAQRMSRIDTASKNMMQGSRLRQSRNLEWGRDIGRGHAAAKPARQAIERSGRSGRGV